MMFQHRNALADRLAGIAGPAGPNHLAVSPRLAALSVLARRGSEAEVAAALAGNPHRRNVGPGEWLLVDADGDEAALADAAAALLDRATLVSQGEGRVQMLLSGPAARAILAKCTPLDLHPDVFAEGHSAQAMLAEVSVNICRTGTDAFAVLAMASFAGWVFEEILAMGQEFGLTAGFSG